MKEQKPSDKSRHKDRPYLKAWAMSAEEVNYHFPVIGIERYTTGIKIIRGCNRPPPPKRPQKDRHESYGKITSFSKKSMSKLAFLTRENATMFNSLLTLTYGDISPRDGRELKVQLNRVLTYLRRKHAAQYVWFLEFTRRGRPHVHILLDHTPSLLDRFYLAEYWANGVSIQWPTNLAMPFTKQVETRNKMFNVHWHKKSWEILRSRDGAARYVTKYATKLRQKDVPKHFADVGRFWGASKEVSLGDPEFKVDVTEDDLRAWLSETMNRDLSHFDVLPKFVYLFDEPKADGKENGSS